MSNQPTVIPPFPEPPTPQELEDDLYIKMKNNLLDSERVKFKTALEAHILQIMTMEGGKQYVVLQSIPQAKPGEEYKDFQARVGLNSAIRIYLKHFKIEPLDFNQARLKDASGGETQSIAIKIKVYNMDDILKVAKAFGILSITQITSSTPFEMKYLSIVPEGEA